jgi:hypothetical protein
VVPIGLGDDVGRSQRELSAAAKPMVSQIAGGEGAPWGRWSGRCSIIAAASSLQHHRCSIIAQVT